MPTAALKHLADKRHIPMDRAEELWDKAKGIVSKEYGSRKKVKGYWALVMGITKKMMGMHEGLSFKEFLIAEAIELAEPDEAEESIGWWIVIERDNNAAWGPFETKKAAAAELEFKHYGYTKQVFIEYGFSDDDHQFHELDQDTTD